MPNWVNNKVQFITDNNETVEFFTNDEHLFSDGLKGMRNNNWEHEYRVCDANTSTKKLTNGLTKVELTFSTAWDAPIPIFNAMEQIFDVHVIAQFAEFGNLLFGEYSMGEVTLYDEDEIPTELLDSLGLREMWEEITSDFEEEDCH